MEDLSGRMDVCVGRPASAPTMNTLLRRTLTASPRPTSVLTLFRSQRLHTSSAARMTAAQHVEGAPPTAVAADKYRPFLDASFYTPGDVKSDWTYQIASADGLDQLSEARQMHAALPRPLRVLVLYGSNRPRSFSKLMAFEAARMLHHLGCDLRIYDPHGLPLKDDYDHPDVDATGGTEAHPKVVELRQLVTWSEAQFWCSPEQHGNITGIMKTMIDHIPLSLGSVRPTQGKVLAVSQVNGGSQSFNAVNSLRILGRWMRMFTIPNQASLPKAWTQFTAEGRMMDSSNRDRLVDVVEELVKVSCLFYGRDETFASRWSERKERAEKGRLLSQAEKEKQKKQEKAAAAAAAKDEKITPDML